ncbi:hypothetical protein BH11MYX1_BH11MYX1_57730 [soil metagenome]
MRSATVAPSGLGLRGRAPRGKHIDYVVAVTVDQRTGKRERIRARTGPDGSYTMQLAKGHRYALAYEADGQYVGAVSFPNAHGAPTTTINVSQSVVVNQNQQHQYVDLGDTNYVNGTYVAVNDPYAYLDSDGDGIVDEQDADSRGDDLGMDVDAHAFAGDFDDVDQPTDAEPSEE